MTTSSFSLLIDNSGEANSPAGIYNVDFIAVHGLYGNIAQSWAPPGSMAWLQTLLPQTLPGIRVYCYEYSPGVYFDQTEASLSKAVVSLKQHMASIDSRSKPRSFVFLGHGFGGILIKKLVCILHDRHKDLLDRISGIMFLSTPHQDSHQSTLPAILGNIVACCSALSARSSRISAIHQSAIWLSTISNEFLARSQTIWTLSYYEEMPTSPMNIVLVDRYAARLLEHQDAGDPFPLGADHQNTCRLLGESNSVCRRLKAKLDSIMYHNVSAGFRRPESEFTEGCANLLARNINQASQMAVNNQFITVNYSATAQRNVQSTSPESLTEEDSALLSRLRPVPEFGRHEEPPMTGTLRWISDCQMYSTWMKVTISCCLLITGYAGCGKSKLLWKIWSQLKSRSSRGEVICGYMFDGRTPRPAGACEILRSYITQVVDQVPKVAKVLRKRFKAGQLLLDDPWSLWSVFLALISQKRVPSLILAIDALDECASHSQAWLMLRLDDLLRNHNTGVKIVLTSRPNFEPLTNTMAMDSTLQHIHRYLHLSMESQKGHIEQDVRTFVKASVQKLMNSSKFITANKQILEDALVERAEATFLWISLVVNMLEHESGPVLRRSNLIKFVEQLPAKLSHLYDSFLNDIPDRATGAKMLTIVALSRRNLTAQEVDILHNILPEHRKAVFEPSLVDSGKMVEKLLPGLVKTTNERVALVHQSLKEHLESSRRTKDSVTQRLLSEDASGDELLLAESCMRYLALDDFQHNIFVHPASPSDTSSSAGLSATGSMAGQTLSTMDSNSIGVDQDGFEMQALFQDPAEGLAERASDLAERFRLLDYASQRWTSHFKHCRIEVPSELHTIALGLCDPSTSRTWFKYLTALDEDGSKYPRHPDALTLASCFGLDSLVSTIDGDNPSKALYWAARNNHSSCIALLLAKNALSSSWAYHDGLSPLAIAAANGHDDAVRRLLAVFDVNERGRENHTPLSLAAQACHVEVVASLLGEDQLKPNIASGQNFATPLILAVSSHERSLETVTLLMADDRVDATKCDKFGSTALSKACEEGLTHILRAMGKKRKGLIKTQDKKGMTPLMHAVRESHMEVIQFLLRHGRGQIDVTERDNTGRNAISWAAQWTGSNILKLMLRNDPEGASQRDDSGWDPLAWAMDPPETPDRIENAEILLNLVASQLGAEAGLELFITATTWGSQTIASMIVSAGIFRVNATTPSGRTALSYAAQYGRIFVVRKLLEQDQIDAQLADCEGNTPYSYAESVGHSDVCDLILKSIKHPMRRGEREGN